MAPMCQPGRRLRRTRLLEPCCGPWNNRRRCRVDGQRWDRSKFLDVKGTSWVSEIAQIYRKNKLEPAIFCRLAMIKRRLLLWKLRLLPSLPSWTPAGPDSTSRPQMSLLADHDVAEERCRSKLTKWACLINPRKSKKIDPEKKWMAQSQQGSVPTVINL